jgi:ribosomal protein L29
MAKAATAAELRGLTRDELNTKVTELKEELVSSNHMAGSAPYARTSRGSTRC